MSAIFGLVHLNGQPVDMENLEAMSLALKDYGVDSDGIWHHDNIGMGQRLMRFTPQDIYEKQPVLSNSRITTLVCDGRIDNSKELAQQLFIPAAQLKHLPNSELILAAYEKWGVECLSYLVGSFAFAIWDQHKKALFLASSKMGERPLYYCHLKETFAFSSMPKGLFTLPGVSRKVDRSYLADYLTDSFIASSRSWYEGIERLPIGHALLLTSQGEKIWRYWKPESLPELRLARDRDYEDAFGEILERTVSDNCASLTPIGVMLSGGLDSASVAAIAAGQLSADNKALCSFTEVPETDFNGDVINGRYADETPFVKDLAAMYQNIQPVFINSSNRFFLEGVTDFFAVAEMPFRNSANKWWLDDIHKVAQLKKNRVLLTGTQGNLTISWNGKGLLPQLLRNGKILRAIYETRNIVRENPGSSFQRILIGQGVMPLMPGLLAKGVAAIRNPRNFINEIGMLPWEHYSPIRADFAREQHVLARAKSQDWGFHVASKLDLKTLRVKTFELSSPIADFAAAYRAIYGVETRDVPADSRLVEFCMSVPEDQWLHKGVNRSLLKRTMKARLPVSILNNRQRGQQAAGWLASLRASQPRIISEFNRIKKSHLAQDALDIARLEKLITALPDDRRSVRDQILDFRNVLQKGLMVGSFLCWCELES